jgi:hypothetical protein
MNAARFEELLGRLLEGELTNAESVELARGLEDSPELLQELRRHLTTWEVWSQHQAPERSAEAFVNAWKTRLRAERENADAFSEALRERLESPGLLQTWLLSLRATVCRPARILWATSLGLVMFVFLFWLTSQRSAQAITSIHGEAVCTACTLHQSHEHLPAIRVTDGRSVRIYYLDHAAVPQNEQAYFCAGPEPVTATGKVEKKEGRLHLKSATVTIPPPQKPDAGSTNNVRIIFPI